METERVRDFIIGIVAMSASFLTGGNVDKVTPSETTQVQQSMHEASHYPEIDGKKTPATPYLTLPFRKTDLPNGYDITEGWIYSAKELKIHKASFVHGGIDFHAPYNTPVVAPTDGYAMSSYHTYRITDSRGQDKLYEDKTFNMGLGYFVRMYIPSVNRFIEIGHLSDIDTKIPFSMPEKTEEGWQPTNHNMKPDEWIKSPSVVFIKRGEPIGKVGYSGLSWGYNDYQEGASRPIPLDNTKFKSWDEPHIHFEEFARDPKTNDMGYHRDPYGIYNTYHEYPTPNRKKAMGTGPLFFLGNDTLPQYADER